MQVSELIALLAACKVSLWGVEESTGPITIWERLTEAAEVLRIGLY